MHIVHKEQQVKNMQRQKGERETRLDTRTIKIFSLYILFN